MTQPAPQGAPRSTRVGTEMVLRILDVPDLRSIPGWREDENTPLGRSAADIAHLARRLDILQQTLVNVATSIRRDMDRVVDGTDVDLQSCGVLGSSGQSLDSLIVRRTALLQELERSVGLHLALAASPLAPPFGQRPAAPAPAKKDKKLTAPQREALEAVSTGKVTMYSSSKRGELRMLTHGAKVSRKALGNLLQRKLVERDTSTSLFVGQTVRPTATGLRMLAVQNTAPAPAPAASPRSIAPAIAAARRPR
ncbi:hypothetical protein HUT16_17400 [Kitasatospora sp. NA04385]|uniref:hypothetical protein n=1 Tax=Kitasatospora sp. NA04385 TaxID=2742135 RepID=UPI001591977D|nr:hypothetical protein [Kitasatospora sp. NA04385]QKW20609.1 hypothetical protein HUT16_17400 [Kitasatospora sp. NA04385]